MKKLLSATTLGVCIVTITPLLLTSSVKAVEITTSSSRVFNYLRNDNGNTSSRLSGTKALLTEYTFQSAQESSLKEKKPKPPKPDPKPAPACNPSNPKTCKASKAQE